MKRTPTSAPLFPLATSSSTSSKVLPDRKKKKLVHRRGKNRTATTKPKQPPTFCHEFKLTQPHNAPQYARIEKTLIPGLRRCAEQFDSSRQWVLWEADTLRRVNGRIRALFRSGDMTLLGEKIVRSIRKHEVTVFGMGKFVREGLLGQFVFAGSLLNKVACTEQFPQNVVTLLHRIQTSFQLLRRLMSDCMTLSELIYMDLSQQVKFYSVPVMISRLACCCRLYFLLKDNMLTLRDFYAYAMDLLEIISATHGGPPLAIDVSAFAGWSKELDVSFMEDRTDDEHRQLLEKWMKQQQRQDAMEEEQDLEEEEEEEEEEGSLQRNTSTSESPDDSDGINNANT